MRRDLPRFTCLPGTLVQESFASHTALQAASGAGIAAHAQTLVPTIAAAKKQYMPQADWSAESLALHIQTVLQGGFVLAKAMNDPPAVNRAKQRAFFTLCSERGQPAVWIESLLAPAGVRRMDREELMGE